MPDAPKPGTGRLGRGARSAQPLTVHDLRAFVRSDFSRRVAVLLACAVTALMLWPAWSTGAGLPAATEGLIRPNATPLSPAVFSHAIWGPVVGLVLVYAVWVWLPWSQRSRRVQVTAYPVTIALLLLAGWLWAVEWGRLRSSAVLVVAVWVALVMALVRSARAESVGFVDRQVTQLPFALLLGWMTVLGAANLALLGREWGIRPWQIPPETWWVLAVVAVLAVAMALVRFLPGRVVIGSAVAWGLGAIAYARLLGQPRAYGVAVACIVSALLILVAAIAVLLWLRTRRLY